MQLDNDQQAPTRVQHTSDINESNIQRHEDSNHAHYTNLFAVVTQQQISSTQNTDASEQSSCDDNESQGVVPIRENIILRAIKKVFSLWFEILVTLFYLACLGFLIWYIVNIAQNLQSAKANPSTSIENLSVATQE